MKRTKTVSEVIDELLLLPQDAEVLVKYAGETPDKIALFKFSIEGTAVVITKEEGVEEGQ